MPATRKVRIEIEVPEGTTLEEILKGVKYRVLPENSLKELIVHARTVEKRKTTPREEPSKLLETERR